MYARARMAVERAVEKEVMDAPYVARFSVYSHGLSCCVHPPPVPLTIESSDGGRKGKRVVRRASLAGGFAHARTRDQIAT